MDNSLTTQYLGIPGEDPTSPPWASGNYVGPFWSNGKLQESVEFGDAPPLHELDALARLHDTAYARYKDSAHRAAADELFAEEAEKLKKKYGPNWAGNPQVAAKLVRYGNHTIRAASRVGGNVATGFKYGGPLGAVGGLLYSGLQNIKQSHDMITGNYLRKERKDLLSLFSKDPMKVVKVQPIGGSVVEPGSSTSKPKKKTLVEKLKNLVTSPTKVVPVKEEGRPAWAIKQSRKLEKFRQRLNDANNRQKAGLPPKRKPKRKKNLGAALPDAYKERKRQEVERKRKEQRKKILLKVGGRSA